MDPAYRWSARKLRRDPAFGTVSQWVDECLGFMPLFLLALWVPTVTENQACFARSRLTTAVLTCWLPSSRKLAQIMLVLEPKKPARNTTVLWIEFNQEEHIFQQQACDLCCGDYLAQKKHQSRHLLLLCHYLDTNRLYRLCEFWRSYDSQLNNLR